MNWTSSDNDLLLVLLKRKRKKIEVNANIRCWTRGENWQDICGTIWNSSIAERAKELCHGADRSKQQFTLSLNASSEWNPFACKQLVYTFVLFIVLETIEQCAVNNVMWQQRAFWLGRCVIIRSETLEKSTLKNRKRNFTQRNSFADVKAWTGCVQDRKPKRCAWKTCLMCKGATVQTGPFELKRLRQNDKTTFLSTSRGSWEHKDAFSGIYVFVPREAAGVSSQLMLLNFAAFPSSWLSFTYFKGKTSFIQERRTSCKAVCPWKVCSRMCVKECTNLH